MSGFSTVDAIRQDVRHALRGFLRTPGFTIATVATLTIGIGAAAAMFSVVDGVLLRGLPYRDADRLYNLFESRADGAGRLPSYPTYKDWQRDSTRWRGALEGMAFIRGADAMLDGDRGPERLLAGYVTPGFFDVMATAPLIGRTFLAGEEQPGANRVAVLSYDLWRTRFHGDASIVGRIVPFAGIPTTIVGVMPSGFAYPAFAQLWEPITHVERTDSALMKRGVHSDARLIGRLRTGIDSATAATSLGTVARGLAATYPEQERWTTVSLISLRDEVLGDTPGMLRFLGGAVVLVLLLAAVNVANLFLARIFARRRELAVRLALGARRGRLIRQLLTESTLLALAGGALGIALAVILVRATRVVAAGQIPRAEELAVDGRVLAATVAATILAVVISGLLPALGAVRSNLVSGLRAGATAVVGGANESRLRGVVVMAQFALAVMLLVGAGLMLQSFRRLAAVPLGFTPDDRVATALYPPAKYASPEADLALYERILNRVRAVPGVRDAAFINHLPLTGASVASPVEVDGGEPDATRNAGALYRTASADYAQTIGLRVTRGRWLNADDMRTGQGFVVNEAMAKRLLPDQDPVGHRLTLRRSSQARADFGERVRGTIVGVVADVQQFRVDQPAVSEVYVPNTLEVWPWISLVVHANHAASTIPALRRAILEVEPQMPVAAEDWFRGGFQTYDQIVARAPGTGQRRLVLAVIGAFALFAIVLAGVGMYGVIAYRVTQRTSEMGVRIALGASRERIVRLVVREALAFSIGGALVGLAAAYACTRFIQAQLYATAPSDIATYVVVPAVLLAVALLAAWRPARRAANLDPVKALRV